MSSSSECITWFAVFLAVSVAVVVVNFLSIILFMKNSNLRTRAMYLVINLTVADMFVGVMSFFYALIQLNASRKCAIVNIFLTPKEKMTMAFLFFWFPLTSLTSIAVISLDRLHATFRPFRHRFITENVYWVTIFAIWVLPAMVSATLQLFFAFWNELQRYYFPLWESYSCLCLFVICVSYSSIVVQFLRGAKPQQHGAAANRQRKLTITLFIMTIVSLLMWLPFVIAALSRLKSMRLQKSFGALFLANSFVNVIVYTIRMPEFRKAILELFKRRQRKNAAVIPLHAR